MLKNALVSSLWRRAGALYSTRCDSIDEKATLEKHVGETPLFYLRSLSEATGCEIYGKAEYTNPSGSVKDRAARQMILEAEQSGRLKPGGTIVEGTGGNTGVALAALGSARGYKVVLTMPVIIAKEKVQLAERFGAQVLLCELVPFTDPRNYARRAATLASEIPGAIHTDQFENLANFRAHYCGTGPEIWRQTQGKIDAFVTSAGTGGTIAGVSAFLKEAAAGLGPPGRVQVWLVDPMGSALFNWVNQGRLLSEGSSEVEGIGIGRITANFKQANLDGAIRCSDQEAIDMCAYLMRNEGLCLGPSAALNVVGAVKMAKKLGPGKTIVTVLCDSGERYTSKIYNDEWLAKMGFTNTTTGKGVEFVK